MSWRGPKHVYGISLYEKAQPIHCNASIKQSIHRYHGPTSYGDVTHTHTTDPKITATHLTNSPF